VWLNSLKISHLRNISDASLNELAFLNLITGQNGSGKSSLLESIHLLAMGRSFRKVKSLVQTDQNKCLIVGKDNLNLTLGIERDIDGSVLIKYQGNIIYSAAELVEIFPLQIINEQAFLLLLDGPQTRRKFMDWGVFHVEHNFIGVWSATQKALKHRNALLKSNKSNIPKELLKVWTDSFVESSLQLNKMRAHWFDIFLMKVTETLYELAPNLSGLDFWLYAGWDISKDLHTLLEDALETDSQRGFTSYGPQRADVKVRYLGKPAEEVLSRGQQKLVVAAMKIAQARVLLTMGKTSSYLIDDIAAELDETNITKLLSMLINDAKQVFMTAIRVEDIPNIRNMCEKSIAMFHVEHGVISRLQG
jgi:DNA replication and repair protein RecF